MIGVGMMSALAEAWQIMSLCLGMSYDEIGDELARWNDSREMVRTGLAKYNRCRINHPILLEEHVSRRYRFSNM